MQNLQKKNKKMAISSQLTALVCEIDLLIHILNSVVTNIFFRNPQLTYSSDQIRKTQNEHPNLVNHNLNYILLLILSKFLNFLVFDSLAF